MLETAGRWETSRRSQASRQDDGNCWKVGDIQETTGKQAGDIQETTENIQQCNPLRTGINLWSPATQIYYSEKSVQNWSAWKNYGQKSYLQHGNKTKQLNYGIYENIATGVQKNSSRCSLLAEGLENGGMENGIIMNWICVPFTLLNSASENIAYTAVHEVYQGPWIGNIQPKYIARWLDDLAFLSLGGIAWQTYFQRVLAASSSKQAMVTSYLSGVLCAIMGIPSILIGAVAVSTDWNQTSYGLPTPYERNEANMILPLVLQYLCPTYVSVAGLGAIAAAVMSSADSSLLSASSMFAYNIYKKMLRKTASEREVLWVMRLSMILLGSAGMGLAFLSNSVYDLWFLSGELVYALLFPQLCCALFIPSTNVYGSAAGFFLGFLLRLLGGENSLKIPPVLHYPGCILVDDTYVQLFPFKTFTMLVSLITIIVTSYLAQVLFMKKILPVQWDVCQVFRKNPSPLSEHELEERVGLQTT
ncbi:unnamed protein product [Ranitomeya imitator]|uniref:Uncharacterized protein n=1 Tax=Ranitomeya imitator TaxID=111125 RepID=A0ABN9LBE6_9NEOB|nr:unnamed protein product [Ranitomeya imitator]